MGPAGGQLWDGPGGEGGHMGLSEPGHPAGVGAEHLIHRSWAPQLGHNGVTVPLLDARGYF